MLLLKQVPVHLIVLYHWFLYQLPLEIKVIVDKHRSNSNCRNDVWHQRIGHPTFKVVSQVLSFCSISFTSNKTSISVCSVYQLVNHTPFQTSSTIYSKPLKLGVSILWVLQLLFLIMVFDIMLPL